MIKTNNNEYKCQECNKFYASKNSLSNHNKRFHNNCLSINEKLTINDDQNKKNITNYMCNYCDNIYKHYQSRWKHEKICENKQKINEIKLNKLQIENEKLKNQIISINCNHIIPLNNTYNNINNINNNYGIINNNQNNNNLFINQVGSEKIDFKTKDILSIARNGLNGAITCVKKTNFNKKKPENHSFCANSLEGKYFTTINEKTQKPESIPKKELIEKVLESSFKIIEGIALQIEFNLNLKKKIPKKERKQIQYILDNKHKFYEKKNWRTFYNSINSMSYNYRKLIINTWNILKPHDNLNSESDESDNISLDDDISLDDNDISVNNYKYFNNKNDKVI